MRTTDETDEPNAADSLSLNTTGPTVTNTGRFDTAYPAALSDSLPSAGDFSQFNPDDLPKDFFGVVAAPRRHGKTTAVLHMLRDFHRSKRFTHVIIFSKTLSGYEEYVPANYQFDDLANLPAIIDRQMDVGEYNSNQNNKKDYVRSSLLLVLDDMAADQSELRSGDTGRLLLSLAVNGRHVTRRDPHPTNECSVIIMTQRLTLIPAPVRGNADFILTSRLANKAERERVTHENLTLHSGRSGMREAYHVLDELTLSKPYRMCVACMHKANRQTHSDYVYYLDADAEAKPVKMFGTEYDWQTKLKRIRF